MSDYIDMKEENLDPKGQDVMENILAEENEVIMWYDSDQSGKVVFINVGNATMSMPENVVYSLPQLSQIADKKLLNFE